MHTEEALGGSQKFEIDVRPLRPIEHHAVVVFCELTSDGATVTLNGVDIVRDAEGNADDEESRQTMVLQWATLRRPPRAHRSLFEPLNKMLEEQQDDGFI